MISIIKNRWRKYGFLFEELVKRDFHKRYKRTYLGIVWSLLGPLLHFVVMALVFIDLLGRNIPHFLIYVFTGVKVYSFFRESTGQGMQSLVSNSGIITKVRVPKYLFLLSKNVSSLINFGIMFIVYIIFVMADGLPLHPRFFLLLYPIITLMLLNIGLGLVLSALYVFFKDIQYLYDIFTMMLMWLSAIFYSIERYPLNVQRLFLLNPVYAHIHYFRLVVLDGIIPSWHIHAICALYAIAALAVGAFIYKRYNYRFIYYM